MITVAIVATLLAGMFAALERGAVAVALICFSIFMLIAKYLP